jgi:hypothetical protein
MNLLLWLPERVPISELHGVAFEATVT